MKSSYTLIKQLSLGKYSREYQNVVRQYLKNELEILKNEGKDIRKMKILNLGAGDCFSSAVLHESAETVISFDISKKQLMYSDSNECGLNRILGSWDNLPFKSGGFDMVFADRCLHHSDNLEKTLCEISYVLKEDGVILATREPTAPYLFSNIIKRRFGREDREKGHIENIYTISEWRNYFVKAGFEVRFYAPKEYWYFPQYGEKGIASACQYYTAKIDKSVLSPFYWFYFVEKLINEFIRAVYIFNPEVSKLLYTTKNTAVGYNFKSRTASFSMLAKRLQRNESR